MPKFNVTGVQVTYYWCEVEAKDMETALSRARFGGDTGWTEYTTGDILPDAADQLDD